MSIETVQQELVASFSDLTDWRDRYRRIIEIGRDLPPLDEAHRLDENIVKGCQNRVWLHAELRDDGHVVFHADSEAQIVRGLVAMLVHVYSGHTPDDIIAAPPAFIQELRLSENLTMNRTNGLAAMTKQMKFYALAFKAQQNM